MRREFSFILYCWVGAVGFQTVMVWCEKQKTIAPSLDKTNLVTWLYSSVVIRAPFESKRLALHNRVVGCVFILFSILELYLFLFGVANREKTERERKKARRKRGYR